MTQVSLQGPFKTFMMKFEMWLPGVGWRAAVSTGAKSYKENRDRCGVEAKQMRKYPTVMTTQYSTAAIVVKNRYNHALVVSSINGTVF